METLQTFANVWQYDKTYALHVFNSFRLIILATVGRRQWVVITAFFNFGWQLSQLLRVLLPGPVH